MYSVLDYKKALGSRIYYFVIKGTRESKTQASAHLSVKWANKKGKKFWQDITVTVAQNPIDERPAVSDVQLRGYVTASRYDFKTTPYPSAKQFLARAITAGSELYITSFFHRAPSSRAEEYANYALSEYPYFAQLIATSIFFWGVMRYFVKDKDLGVLPEQVENRWFISHITLAIISILGYEYTYAEEMIDTVIHNIENMS